MQIPSALKLPSRIGSRSIKRVRSPAQPRAVQLFGVVPAELAGRRFIVDGKAAAAVAYGNLALVIRDVDPSEWNPEDHNWIARQAAVHQRVLERAMHAGPVVPAGFCTVFRGREELDALVRNNGERWRKALARLAGKQEWCLHVYWGPHVASHFAPYVMRVAPASGNRLELQGRNAAHLNALWKACAALASASRRIEPLPNPHYLFGATFLMRRARLREFRGVLLRFAGTARELGLTYYLDGPHPPFTFA